MAKTTRWILGVTSVLLLAFAACMLAATIALIWLPGMQRSSDGFVTSDAVRVATHGYAITSTDIDIGAIPEEWLPANIVGTFRFEAESEDGSQLFLGVGPSHEVDAYLTDVPFGVVSQFGPWNRVEVTEHQGSTAPANPGEVDFWTASTDGNGMQTIDWEAEAGEWTLVVMHPDVSPGVDVLTSIGIDTPWLPIGLVVTSLLTLVAGGVGAVLAVLVLRHSVKPPREQLTPPAQQPADAST